MEKFSVLLSLYDKEMPSNLFECLDSLHRQSLISDEVVIVYDGHISSPLDDVVNHWARLLPIKKVIIENNVGLGIALNFGLRCCSNNIVVRMDTDDICKPDRFFQLVSFMSSNKDMAVLGSHVDEFTTDISQIVGKKKVPCGFDEIKRFSLKRNPFNHMSVAFRKDMIDAVGGYKHHYFMEDYNLWLRVIASGYLVGNIDASLMYARVGKGMLERRRGIKYVLSEFQLAKLKVSLNLQGYTSAYSLFFLRSLVRMTPLVVTQAVYSFIRK